MIKRVLLEMFLHVQSRLDLAICENKGESESMVRAFGQVTVAAVRHQLLPVSRVKQTTAFSGYLCLV